MNYLFFVSIFVMFEDSGAVNKSDCLCIPLRLCPAFGGNFVQAHTELYKEIQCGTFKDIQKVCCPLGVDCYTPDGETGTCDTIHECPHLIKLLRPENSPISKKNLIYLQMSKAACTQTHPRANEVCCGPPPNTKVGNCDTSMISALPVDPHSGCCGRHAESDNGSEEKSTITRYPWMAIIEYQKKGTEEYATLCNGVLISDTFILTAGYCHYIGEPERVRLGYRNPNGSDCVIGEDGHKSCNDNEVEIDILDAYYHREYKQGNYFYYDIGIIEIKRKAPYTDYIRPICLPMEDITLAANRNVTLIAVGWISNINHSTSDVKQSTLSFVHADKCLESFNSSNQTVTLWEGNFCAIAEDPTHKENMGKILISLNGKTVEIIGFKSLPSTNGAENLPEVYSNVFKGINWIQSFIRNSVKYRHWFEV